MYPFRYSQVSKQVNTADHYSISTCPAYAISWLQVASARLGLGVTTLKRVCRASNMKRWPFRKRNSLGRLIDRTKQVLDDGTGQDNMQKLAALQVLEKQRQVMRVSFWCSGCERSLKQ